MTPLEFWQAVYVAKARAGNTTEWCARCADEAVADLKTRLADGRL